MTSPHWAPPCTFAIAVIGSISTFLMASSVTRTVEARSCWTSGPALWPVLTGATLSPSCRDAATTADTSAAVTGSATAAGRRSTAVFHRVLALSYPASPGRWIVTDPTRAASPAAGSAASSRAASVRTDWDCRVMRLRSLEEVRLHSNDGRLIRRWMSRCSQSALTSGLPRPAAPCRSRAGTNMTRLNASYSSGPLIERRSGEERQSALQRQMLLDGGGEALGLSRGGVLGGGLDHDADERLGAGGAQQHTSGVGELGFDGGHLGGDLRVVAPVLVHAFDVDQGLRQLWDLRGEVGQGALGIGHALHQMQGRLHAVAGRAVVEHEHMPGLLTAEDVA